MKLLLIAISLFLSRNSFAQDTVAVSSIAQAITEAEKGNFVSLGIFSDAETTFPENVFLIPKNQLIGLIIDDCNYRELPSQISEFSNLVYFRYSWFMYSDCPLTVFPEFINNTASLEHLAIEGAQFKSIPSLSKLKNLDFLQLYSCNLKAFPSTILEITTVINLDLSCNDFTAIPEGIDKMENLKRIEFNGGACGSTPIKIIPKSLANLKNLEYFSYGNTEITESMFPDFFKSLPISE